MDIEITVRVNGRYISVGAGIKVPELYESCFEPMRVCDEPLMALVTGDILHDKAEIVMKTREDAAEILAKELSSFLVDAMKKNDTYNGYKEEVDRYEKHC